MSLCAAELGAAETRRCGGIGQAPTDDWSTRPPGTPHAYGGSQVKRGARQYQSLARHPLSVGEGRPAPGLNVWRLVVIVVVVVIVSVMIVMVMIAHRVANRRATNSAHDGADWTAHHRSADRAGDPSGDRTALVSQRC